MRRLLASVAVIAFLGLGCTAFVLAGLSGTGGNVQHFVGGCFRLADTTCGECIANNCEDPNNPSQPVSLEKVCSLNQYATIISAAASCSQSSSVNDYNCTGMYIDGGTYATSIDDESAAVNNVKKCITDHCTTSCSRCAVQVPTCGSDTIDLLEAGTCAACIDQMMNTPGGTCQSLMLQQGAIACSEYPSSSIAQCAIPQGTCQSPDCSNIEAADAGLYKCLNDNCIATSQCPSQ
jgi:hypothetical protein